MDQGAVDTNLPHGGNATDTPTGMGRDRNPIETCFAWDFFLNYQEIWNILPPNFHFLLRDIGIGSVGLSTVEILELRAASSHLALVLIIERDCAGGVVVELEGTRKVL